MRAAHGRSPVDRNESSRGIARRPQMAAAQSNRTVDFGTSRLAARERIYPDLQVSNAIRWRRLMRAEVELPSCRFLAVCHEYRRSIRRCVTVREMEEGPSRSAIRC